jgi:two-component system, NtrC family, response regulator AlgB
MTRLLVVDDEKSICSTIEAAMKCVGHDVEVADSGEMALSVMRRHVPDILLTDLRMDGMSGLDLLGKAREYFPSVTVVVMTAFATIDTAVSAMKSGAYDYLVKPFTPEQLEHLVERIEEFRRLREENTKLRDQVDALSEPSSIVTKNARMQKVLETAKKVAVTDSTILITGESGTGKTMLAKTIHDGSPRNKGPFAVVNCATLSENLLESELFGHARGSFTGAVKDKVGRLQVADTGTVFLDEIGEISPSLQTKLLRFLQEREFERVGDTKTIRVDVRIIAATNKDLEREVREGRFREDLYFRLNVIELHMPSLRQRTEDVIQLADQLLTRSFLVMNRTPRPLNEQARAAILGYGWPGNIRELKNALERAAILSTGDLVTFEDLPDRVIESQTLSQGGGIQPGIAGVVATAMTPSDVSLEELEKQHIQHVLATASTLEEAASILGINLSTLWRKRRRYNLD